MNILLVCKLSDQTLEENVLLPLLSCNLVDNIYLLRDTPVSFHDSRIRFIGQLKKGGGIFRHFVKLSRGVIAVRKNGINAIVGVLNTPHGFIGRTISYISRVPYIHMTIAGHREFWRGGTVFEKVNFRYLLKGSTITVTGKQTQEYLVERGIPLQKVFILPNLPNERFGSVGNTLDREYDIVSFSRIDKNKNVALLLKAIACLHYFPGLRVAIAGDGDLLESLKQQAKDLNLTDRVSFLGYVKGVEKKIEVLSHSKIFVSCSKGEGFPVSLLEAMECGCVPVVSDVGDIPDVIRHGENGFMFHDTDNESELVSFLDRLLSDKDDLLRLSNEAQKVKESFSVSANGRIWEDVFRCATKR